MATIDDKGFVDNIIANNGFYNGDDEDAPDNPRCVKVVEYINQYGKVTWGVILKRDNPNKYMSNHPYVNEPKTIWEYKA